MLQVRHTACDLLQDEQLALMSLASKQIWQRVRPEAVPEVTAGERASMDY